MASRVLLAYAGMAVLSGLVITGIAVCSLGGLFLFWRILHIFRLGEFWNNIPNIFHWGYAIMFTGVVVIFTAIISTFTTCPDSCSKVKSTSDPATLGWMGGFVILGGWLIKYCCCNAPPAEDGDTPLYSWGDPAHNDHGYDHRPRQAGVDIALILAGLAIIVVDNAVGVCPASCAEAVVVT
jgi:hypothetical protein